MDRDNEQIADGKIQALFFKTLEFFKSKHIWLSSGIGYQALPEKTRLSIEKQQNISERLIGWIQLTILLVFAVLYTLAPKTVPTHSEFEPVPLFLGAYFVFTCIRLYLAYKDSLPFSILVLSVLVDMGLLFGLVWSFHIQYMQPPSFYLKSPTLLYIFIFIALRALRFEPGFVLLSGLVGAGGWMLLVGLAIVSGEGQSVITRDYIQYLTSNSVLVGAELDKVLSILVVTVILTFAIARARRLLVSSIVEGDAAQSLSRFVPESIASQIASADGPLIDSRTESRETSILFLDLVSFTTLAERLSPEKLIATMNEYFSVISGPIGRNNGVINQFQGDAILASFNLPVEDSDHAGSAVAAALEIQQILGSYRFDEGLELFTRAGINTGVVVGGFVGTTEQLSYTVYGDDVNIAARLQELSKQYKTSNLVSLSTMQLCDPKRFRFTQKGSEVLRGRLTPVEFFEASFR